MTEELRKTDTQKQEIVEENQVERTRETRLFVPRVDIYESKDDINLIADIPGADQDSIEITLEKNILAIENSGELKRMAAKTAAMKKRVNDFFIP